MAQIESLWSRLPSMYRRDQEKVLWQGPVAVATSVASGGRPLPIDVAGADRGFAVLTDSHLIIGNYSKLLRRPSVWESFSLADLTPNLDDPRGCAFVVKAIGPVDFVVISPSTDHTGFREAVMTWLRDSSKASSATDVQRILKEDERILVRVGARKYRRAREEPEFGFLYLTHERFIEHFPQSNVSPLQSHAFSLIHSAGFRDGVLLVRSRKAIRDLWYRLESEQDRREFAATLLNRCADARRESEESPFILVDKPEWPF